MNRPITPTLPPKVDLAKPVPGKWPSLKHPQPKPGWVVMPKMPGELAMSPRKDQKPREKDVESCKSTDIYSAELITPLATRQYSSVSTGNTSPSPSSSGWVNSYASRHIQQECLELKVASSTKVIRSGGTGIPPTTLGSLHPQRHDSTIGQSCTLDLKNEPLRTTGTGGTDSNQHPCHPIPKNSIYQKDPAVCWGCEDAKSQYDKVTGLCKKCELYLIPCLEWTPDKTIQTPRTTIHHSQGGVPIQGTYGQRPDSPTIGQSATHIRISQPGAKGKGRVMLPVIYPSTLPASLVTENSEYGDYVSPPGSHFSNTTIGTSSCRSLTSEDDIIPFHDNSGVLDKEIQALCNYWNSGTESSATSSSSNCTTNSPCEQILLHPTPKVERSIRCFMGPPSPGGLTEPCPSSSPGGPTLLSLNARQRSHKGIISGVYQHLENQDAIGDCDSVSGSDEGQQDVICRLRLEEGPLAGSRLSRPASSIYSLYLDTT